MGMTPVGEVWGIGPRTRQKLQAMGIETVLDFALMDAAFVRRRFGVVLERTHQEVNGMSCIALEENLPARQQIVRSRSFSKSCTQIEPLLAAVAVHMTEAVRLLRLQKCAAHTVGVLFHTDPFREGAAQYGVLESTRLEAACADLMTLTSAALGLVRRFYKSGFAYKKAGVFLSDFVDEKKALAPLSLFDMEKMGVLARRERMQHSLDDIARRFGKRAVTVASAKLSDEWLMKRDLLSACPTTNWDDILKVS